MEKNTISAGRQMMKKLGVVLLGIWAVLITAGLASAAQWANPGLLVNPDQVKANIDKPNWVVVDARKLVDYLDGHIPGAISLGDQTRKVLRDTSSRVYQDVTIYEKLLGLAGIDNNTHVVFYHDKMDTLTDATVGFWVMEYLGHDKVYVLNGGLDAWRKAGNRLDKAPTIKAAKTFKANVVPGRIATTDEILQIANGKKTGVQLIDSRSKKEHEGADIRALQGGHVPNTTLNVSHLDTLEKIKDPKTDKMKEIPVLSYSHVAKHFAALDPAKRTMAYCQSGTRSTLTYLQLRLLGFNDAANWDDSWQVYGSNLGANHPIAAPNGHQYYNFDAVNSTLKDLEKKVKELEGKLAGDKK
jgi:thiosulfate/3-mercaptopyruvate sulfurtransferase